MDYKTKLILALIQIENVHELLKDGQYAGFFSSHVFPIKFEIQRQIANLTNTSLYTKIKE
jgi:hypothetical protein